MFGLCFTARLQSNTWHPKLCCPCRRAHCSEKENASWSGLPLFQHSAGGHKQGSTDSWKRKVLEQLRLRVIQFRNFRNVLPRIVWVQDGGRTWCVYIRWQSGGSNGSSASTLSQLLRVSIRSSPSKGVWGVHSLRVVWTSLWGILKWLHLWKYRVCPGPAPNQRTTVSVLPECGCTSNYISRKLYFDR